MEILYSMASKIILSKANITKNNNELLLKEISNQLPFIYTVLRKLTNHDFAVDCLQTIVSQTYNQLKNVTFVNESSQSEFIKLSLLKNTYQIILKPHFEYFIQNELSFLSRDDAFLLILKDKFNLSTYELASLFNTSTGTIKTRLFLIRKKVFEKLNSKKIQISSYTITDNEQLSIKESIDDKSTQELQELLNQPSIAPALQMIIKLKLFSINLLNKNTDPIFPEALLKNFSFDKIHLKSIKNFTTRKWYYKIFIEASLFFVLIIGVVYLIPKLRIAYNYWLEKRFNLYNLTEYLNQTNNLNEDLLKELETKYKMNATKLVESNQNTIQDEINEILSNQKSNNLSSSKQTSKNQTIDIQNEFGGKTIGKPDSNKVYRILISSDTPIPTAQSISQFLKNIELVKHFTSSEIPGGIMFDLYIPIQEFQKTLDHLTTLGKVRVITTKARYHKPIKGTAHIIVWIQKI